MKEKEKKKEGSLDGSSEVLRKFGKATSESLSQSCPWKEITFSRNRLHKHLYHHQSLAENSCGKVASAKKPATAFRPLEHLDSYTFCSWRFERHILMNITHLYSKDAYLHVWVCVIYSSIVTWLQVKTFLPIAVKAGDYPGFTPRTGPEKLTCIFIHYLNIFQCLVFLFLPIII